MSTLRKLILIPVTIISHILAEIHAEYLRVLGNKRTRNLCAQLDASVAKAKAEVAAAKAAAEKAGLKVVAETAQAVQGAVAAAPVLPH